MSSTIGTTLPLCRGAAWEQLRPGRPPPSSGLDGRVQLGTSPRRPGRCEKRLESALLHPGTRLLVLDACHALSFCDLGWASRADRARNAAPECSASSCGLAAPQASPVAEAAAPHRPGTRKPHRLVPICGGRASPRERHEPREPIPAGPGGRRWLADPASPRVAPPPPTCRWISAPGRGDGLPTPRWTWPNLIKTAARKLSRTRPIDRLSGNGPTGIRRHWHNEAGHGRRRPYSVNRPRRGSRAHRLGFTRVATDYGDPVADEGPGPRTSRPGGARSGRNRNGMTNLAPPGRATSSFDREPSSARLDRGVPAGSVAGPRGPATTGRRVSGYAKAGVSRWFEGRPTPRPQAANKLGAAQAGPSASPAFRGRRGRKRCSPRNRLASSRRPATALARAPPAGRRDRPPAAGRACFWPAPARARTPRPPPAHRR